MENNSTAPVHTPGPWSLDEARMYVGGFLTANLRASGCPSIACVYHLGTPAGRANARLIAAAPSLLRLARLFRMTCEDRLSLLQEDERDWRPTDEWEDMIGHYTALLRECENVLVEIE